MFSETPKFSLPRANAPQTRGAGKSSARCAKENRRACLWAHSGSSFGSALARSGALSAKDPVVQVLTHVVSPPG